MVKLFILMSHLLLWMITKTKVLLEIIGEEKTTLLCGKNFTINMQMQKKRKKRNPIPRKRRSVSARDPAIVEIQNFYSPIASSKRKKVSKPMVLFSF